MQNESLSNQLEKSIMEKTPASKRHLLNLLIKQAKHKALVELHERESMAINVMGQ